MGKYDDLVFTIPKEFHSWYGFATPRGFFRGTTMMEKAKVYLDFTSITKELIMEYPHTHHAVDEYIVLATADFNHFFDGFDAEIDIWLGEDPTNLEMVTITQPAIIRIPPKLYHCPINFRAPGSTINMCITMFRRSMTIRGSSVRASVSAGRTRSRARACGRCAIS